MGVIGMCLQAKSFCWTFSSCLDTTAFFIPGILDGKAFDPQRVWTTAVLMFVKTETELLKCTDTYKYSDISTTFGFFRPSQLYVIKLLCLFGSSQSGPHLGPPPPPLFLGSGAPFKLRLTWTTCIIKIFLSFWQTSFWHFLQVVLPTCFKAPLFTLAC